jgi:hypothetical protein
MNDEQQRLEKLGYAFDVEERPVTEPGSKSTTYFTVAVRYHDKILGTRSELRRDRALERALNFAQEHETQIYR